VYPGTPAPARAFGDPRVAGGRSYARRKPEESVLYRVVQEELETFLASACARERPVPRFVARELRAFLRCGILAYGFVRVHCDGCGLDRVVAFSYKGRGFCPSCGGRRMADTAAHLVDRVLPKVPVRQWVLSLPFALRYRLAYQAPLVRAVLEVFVRCVFASLRRRARKQWTVPRGRCGAVTFIQRFGDALNLNVHFHSLALDGVYDRSENGALCFRPLSPPDDAEVERVARQVARRLARLLERRGLGDDAPAEGDALAMEEPLLASLCAASVTGRVATGYRRGRRVLRVGDRIDADDIPVLQGERCASVGGVSVHADVAVPARDRRRLERLCRYGARPPVATERLSRLEDGRLLYRLKHRWRDGTTHVVFTPQELLEKLAALVPPPRFHLFRYHSVLGPCASARDRIVPAGLGERHGGRCSDPEPSHAPPRAEGAPHPRSSALPGSEVAGARKPGQDRVPTEDSPSSSDARVANTTAAANLDPGRPRRLAWADLLRRVFAIDVLECPRCRGPMRILAAIHPPGTPQAILACMRLPVRAPPLAPARRDDGFDDRAADQAHADFEP
jgi:hypothetical protein